METVTPTQLDTLLEPYHGRKRDALLPLLWDVQTAVGHIDAAAVHQISHTLRVPEAEIYGVIEFYSLFHTQPTGERIIRICTDPSCGLAGADDVMHQLENQLGIQHGETTADGAYTLEHSPCLGLCDHAPACLISQRIHGETLIPNVNAAAALAETLPPDYPAQVDSMVDVLLAESPAFTGYPTLQQVLANRSPEQVIQMVEDAGLIGRGGAAFPTGLKWKLTRQTESEVRYLVCNADESEPGTFKDRVLMEHHPHTLIEGMLLAAYAIGATQGYIFIRGEYPLATERLQNALREATAAGFLGDNIFGTDFHFQIEIRRGAGAYICGEETALFEAIEGKRGFPRIKPPYPTTHGLFGKPTVVNNVETLCAIPSLLQHGADWFRSLGTERSTGSKLVSVSGHVRRPGVVEIQPGLTLRALLEEHCGGVVGDLQAVLMGGAAGTFLTPAQLDTRLTFEALRAIGGTFGSGAVMVFNTQTDLRDVLLRLGRFFQHESCGKCFPCQLGTQRQVEILARLPNPLPGDAARLRDVGLTMTEASLCGLGQTAASAVLSAMKQFPHLFEGGSPA